MPILEKKVLLFIKARFHNLKPIESFLAKRNFDVHSEADLREAIGKILDLKPNFIFIAWDHANPKIFNLPKLIAQAGYATVVPYIMSTTKEDTLKLMSCPINPKLYPPLSGPAIERLIIKLTRQATETQTANKQLVDSEKKMGESLSQLKAYFMSHIENEKVENITEALAEENKHYEQQKENSDRFEAIKKRNSLLKHANKINLQPATVDELKKSFQKKIKLPLESILNALSEANENLSTPPNEVASTTAEKEAEKIKIFCMSVFSDDWCGYLIISTDADLDFSSIEIIFSDWIKLQLNNVQEINESDFIELNNLDPRQIEPLSAHADYFESVKINNHSLSVSFFSIEASKMTIELTDDNQLIKIATQDIPSETEIKFSLHLHLPENKKYLIYTQVNKKFNQVQKDRLLNNKISTLYTPIEFEKEYKKFIAEKNVTELYENLLKKLPVA